MKIRLVEVEELLDLEAQTSKKLEELELTQKFDRALDWALSSEVNASLFMNVLSYEMQESCFNDDKTYSFISPYYWEVSSFLDECFYNSSIDSFRSFQDEYFNLLENACGIYQSYQVSCMRDYYSDWHKDLYGYRPRGYLDRFPRALEILSLGDRIHEVVRRSR